MENETKMDRIEKNNCCDICKKVENMVIMCWPNHIAFGMAYCLDNGFWNILLDSLLGSIYIAYKLTQYLVKFVGPL